MWNNTLALLCMSSLVIAAASCNQTGFQAQQQQRQPLQQPSQEPVAQPPASTPSSINENRSESQGGLTTVQGTTQNYRITCQNNGIQKHSLTAPEGTTLKVTGELCPKSFGQLNVLFVVDFSGSMDQNDPRNLLLSCGRLAAARAIVKKFEDDMGQGDDVKIGLVSFDDVGRITKPLQPLKDFKSTLNIFQMCGSNEAATNYKAAFDTAAQALTGAQGNKVIYFISDGLPTSGGPGTPDNTDAQGIHKAAGLQSSQVLLTGQVSINAVFLNKDNSAQAGAAYLNQITGNPQKVRVANDANQLADKVIELAIPRVNLIDAQASANLVAGGAAPAPIKLVSFKRDASRPAVWVYETEPIVLKGTKGTAVLNKVTVTAPGTDNRPHETVAEVNFTAQ
jgi:hypothetical protein